MATTGRSVPRPSMSNFMKDARKTTPRQSIILHLTRDLTNDLNSVVENNTCQNGGNVYRIYYLYY